MNTLNKNLLMGGVAACAVAFASCGDKKTESTDVTPDRGNTSASTDTATAPATPAATTGIETVSLNLSGLK